MASIRIENTTKTSAVIRFEGFDPPVHVVVSHRKVSVSKSTHTDGEGFVEVSGLSPGVLYDVVASSTGSYESLYASFSTLSPPKPSTPKLSVDYYSRDRFRASWSSGKADFYRVRIFRDGWEDSFDTKQTQLDQISRAASQVAVHVQAHRASEVSVSSSAYVNRPELLPALPPKPPAPNSVPPPPPKQTPIPSASKENPSVSVPVGWFYLISIIFVVLTLISGCQMAQEDNHFLIIIILSPAVASVWLALLALHFLPTCIAVVRKTSNRKKVFMMNLFLGWTFLGWIVALVWSFG